MTTPKFNEQLSSEQISFLQIFSKSCRKSILEMVVNAQSGHPGGSLSSIDYLATIYAFIISQTGEKVVVSNGHISPAVYSVLAELNYIPKKEVVENFRKAGSVYEGHVTRHVRGVEYGTGPLGIGASVSAGFALGEKLNSENKKVFALIGDGECQEGQVHEMINFARQFNLSNLITFIDYNQVQLTASLKEIMDIDIKKTFEAGHWNVLEIDAHNYQEIWHAISQAYQENGKPTVIIGHSIMGKGVGFMEKTGEAHQSDWHGKAPEKNHPELDNALQSLSLNDSEEEKLKKFIQQNIQWQPKSNNYPDLLSPLNTQVGEQKRYQPDESIDCRGAYGKALLDLAKLNKNVVALTADLKGSVKTDGVAKELPAQHIECGIAEQHMVSTAGALSLQNFIPFASTFGAFMTSRAKDQARVNDINFTNVKMVATHCGLSVGEDGPTHQAIDDMGSFLGLFNTMIIEPADPNQTDAIIRYIASHFGNFYVRMGRHKFPVLTKENGEIFFGIDYKYQYGQCDIIREGSDLTIAATGATVYEAFVALEMLKKEFPNKSVELISISSIKKFDKNLLESLNKTKKLITVEDHNLYSGLANQISQLLVTNKVTLDSFTPLALTEYQLSGTADQLYKKAKIDSNSIYQTAANLLK